MSQTSSKWWMWKRVEQLIKLREEREEEEEREKEKERRDLIQLLKMIIFYYTKLCEDCQLYLEMEHGVQ